MQRVDKVYKKPLYTTGEGNLVKTEEQSAIILTRWAHQTCVLEKALFVVFFVYVLVQGPEEHVHPTKPKLTLPGASSSLGVSQQEPQTHSCSPVFACLSSPPCKGRITGVGVARAATEWQRGQNDSGNNQSGLIGLIPLKRQMCIAMFLLHGQIYKNSQLCEFFFCVVLLLTVKWPGIDIRDSRLVGRDWFF